MLVLLSSRLARPLYPSLSCRPRRREKANRDERLFPARRICQLGFTRTSIDMSTSVQCAPMKFTGSVPRYGFAEHAGLFFISNAYRNGLGASKKLRSKALMDRRHGDVRDAIWNRNRYQINSPVGARKKLIQLPYLVFHLSHVVKHALDRELARIRALRYVMRDLVRHARRWALRRVVSVERRAKLGVASTQITRMAGAVGKCAMS